MKILIVNDSEDDVHLLEHILKKHGFEVTSASDGLEALDALKDVRFDLIISDILMPRMDGLELCRKCKTNKDYRNIPFIFYTATFTTGKAREYAMNLGADKLLVKPIDHGVFIDEIVRTLNNYKKTPPPHFKATIEKDETEVYRNYNEYLIHKLENQLLDFEKESKEFQELKEKEDDKSKKQAILQLINEMFDTAHDLLTVESSMRIYLKKICRYLGWPVGHVYKTIDTANGSTWLKSAGLWYFEYPKQFGLLRRTSESTVLRPGEDLPGKVFLSGKMEWISDVAKDINFTRAQYANMKSIDIGVKGAFAFPIKEGNKIRYIFEFFSKKEEKPKALLFEVVDNLSLQLGRVIERKRAEEKIRKLSQVVEQSRASIMITNKEGIIEYVNPKFSELTGYSNSECIGLTPRILKSGKTPHETYRNLWNTIISGKEWQGELLNKKKNGELYWEHVHISPIRNPKGHVIHYLAIKEDITEHKRFETHLMNMATRDPLTNLFNRRRFQEELEYWVAQSLRYGATGALLFLDLDNFKYVNDTLGHQAGDELLIRLAEMLRSRLRDTDIFARFGGDEFAIILPYTDIDKARLIAGEILELTREQSFEQYKVTFSIGIVIFPEHGRDAETLLTYADLAMYSAKEKGRNRFCVFSYEQKTHIESQISWEKRIRDALDNDRFVLHLQPVINIPDKKIIGYEALIRMIGDESELILPAEFLNIAERFGLIRDIDRWVVRNAVRLARDLQFYRRGIFLDINLSGKAFTDPELLGIIRQQFNTSDIHPGSFVFEITETATIENMIEAQDFLAALKKMNCCFSLDDFGSGFSSFNYLKHLSVDYLKIDGSFIHDLPGNSVDQHLVKAMVEVAHGLGKRTVAEFVGSEETLKLLRKLGVNYAQGNYIGKPRSVPEIFN
ncbi:MAG: EAL domain-containing protein [Candidatus Kuenenia sp.]|nr:EAL domain-containing protein [Candidatus Kuenenia hertensis]